ncbi:MAG: Na+/H+ antiporter NhaC family protein [Eubacteriales bacterium]
MNKTIRTAVVILMTMAMIPSVFASGEDYVSPFYNSAWALLPPMIAIILALITKEVYSSLFIGILVGGLLYSNFDFELTANTVFVDGILGSVSDGYNVGILIFLVLLGAMVAMMNRAGGSAAFGRWAAVNIKSRVGAQLASIMLGCLIFIDDYFNCLTVGSVMRPVTDSHNISRAKLAYLIDATAAPICIIAPVSSWAAAVAGFAPEGQGLTLFIQAIPYNFYAIFTILLMIGLVVTRTDIGPMAQYEKAAMGGDLFNGSNPYVALEEDEVNQKGTILDLVVPVVMLVVCCVSGMLYSGGFFSGESIIVAFSDCDASLGLMLGSAFGFLLTIIFYMIRRSIPFRTMMECLPEGFKAMVPAIMILTFAWTLKSTTDSLGLATFVEGVVSSSAEGFQLLLPAIIFVVAHFLAFASGTSWGTFGILIPITLTIFPLSDPMGVICVSACMAGATCGDHCSPISDTSIMASAGAQCDHVSHVATQLPYAISVAVISTITYVVAAIVKTWVIALPFGAAITIGYVFYLKNKVAKASEKTV